jgi:hypothetical protein
MPAGAAVFFIITVVAGAVIALKALAAAFRAFWAGVVEIATHVATVIGVVICVLGGLATLVALLYVAGTFAERLYRLRLGARHQRDQLAMEWDQMIMKNDSPASIGWDGPFPEDFDG